MALVGPDEAKQRPQGQQHERNFGHRVRDAVEALLRKPQVLQDNLQRLAFCNDPQQIRLDVLEQILPFLAIHHIWYQSMADVE